MGVLNFLLGGKLSAFMGLFYKFASSSFFFFLFSFSSLHTGTAFYRITYCTSILIVYSESGFYKSATRCVRII